MLVPSSLRAYPLYPCTVGTYKPLACLPLMDPDLLSLAIPRKCVDASDIQLPSKSSSKVTHDGSSKSPTKPSMVDQLVQSALHYAGAAPTKSGHDTETVVTTPASSSHPSKMSRMHFYLTAPTTPSHRFQPFGRNPQAEASTTSPRPGKCTTGVCKTKRDTLDRYFDMKRFADVTRIFCVIILIPFLHYHLAL